MVDLGSEGELSHQVTSRAARAGVWMTIAGVVLFVSGMLAGLTLDRRLMGQPVHQGEGTAIQPPAGVNEKRADDEKCGIKPGKWFNEDFEPGSPEMLDAVSRRVREVLELDDEQEKSVRVIIKKYHPRMEELRKEFEPELRKLALTALVDFWPVLEPEQRKRLERILGRHGRWLIRSVTQPASAPSTDNMPGPATR